MSTTWVFLGLMGGREIGIAIEGKACGEEKYKDRTILEAFKMSITDIIFGLIGLGVSVALVQIKYAAEH